MIVNFEPDKVLIFLQRKDEDSFQSFFVDSEVNMDNGISCFASASFTRSG
jgi:hypothetical protein